MSLAKEFREFILRGSVIDMSVGIIVGAAFSKLVDSLVKDVIMPPIGLLLGKVDFSNLFITLKEGAQAGPYYTLDMAQKAGAVTINLGLFINGVISLIIVGFAVFALVKGINAFHRKHASSEAEAPTTKECPFCCSSIAFAATRCPNCTSELSQ